MDSVPASSQQAPLHTPRASTLFPGGTELYTPAAPSPFPQRGSALLGSTPTHEPVTVTGPVLKYPGSNPGSTTYWLGQP